MIWSAFFGAFGGIVFVGLVAYTYVVHIAAPRFAGAIAKSALRKPEVLADIQNAETGADAAAIAIRAELLGDQQVVGRGCHDDVPDLEIPPNLTEQAIAPGGFRYTNENLLRLACALDLHQFELRERCGCGLCGPLTQGDLPTPRTVSPPEGAS